MFRELDLRPVYTSDDNNISQEFYTPVLKNATTFDRTSAYFSAKALALYSDGLEYFGKSGKKYRLIISQEISEDDYNQIKKGYSLRDSLNQKMLNSLHEDLSLKEEKQISNLAYFIALGTVDIKIAFRKTGIFHDKCGIVTDEIGDIICFRGSNNETEAAINSNYESFQVICSWLDANDFYLSGILQSQKEFDNLWNNTKNGLIVLPVQEVIKNEILKFNKGNIIVDEIMLKDNAVILDYDNQLILQANIPDINWILNKAFYKMRLKYHVEKIKNNKIYFKEYLTYIDYEKINNVLSKKLDDSNFIYLTTQRYKDYIEAKNIHIKERATLGLELKSNSNRFKQQYSNFKDVIEKTMERKLRDKQLKDAFYMLVMNKSGNFSVPGSGKTTSALAVYAFLKHKGLVSRIVMIGPKNAFGSWIDEFKACFGKKEQLSVFNIQDPSYHSPKNRIQALQFDSGNCNLFLFNYESLAAYRKEITDIVSTNTLLVFDEVHKVKAINGQRATEALEISKKSSYTIVMTGTPIPNSYLDLYNLLHLLFNDEYKDFFNFDTSTLKNPSLTDIQLINTKIQPFFCRTTKQELNVPKANEDLSFNIKCSKEEQRLFEILCQKYRSNKLALFVRILQLESNPKLLLEKIDLSELNNVLEITEDINNIDFVDYSNEFKDIVDKMNQTTKKNECLRIVQNLVNENKKVIIWCIFKDTMYSLTNKLNELDIKTEFIAGEVPLEDRNQLLDDFKNNKFDVLITNPHTLAESVSLHSICHDAIYFEYSYNLVHLLQSKDRIHRLGLPNNQYTQYYYLKTYYHKYSDDYSMDEVIYQRLKEKEKTMLNAIDNHVLEPVYTPEEDIDLIFKTLLD